MFIAREASSQRITNYAATLGVSTELKVKNEECREFQEDFNV